HLEFSVLQTQKKDDLTAIFRTPVAVRFVYEGGEEFRELEIEKPAHRYRIKLPKRPKWISFDPGNSVPKTLKLDLSEDMLIAQLENDDCCMGRVHAVRALSGKPTLKTVRALKAALYGDKFWGVQAEAAAALGKVHTSDALKALTARKVRHVKTRRAVAKALGEWRNAEAAQALTELLKKDESYFVEAEAALALGRTREPVAFAALKKALVKKSHNDAIRNFVFNGFVALRDMRALEIMSEWTSYGQSQQARYAAISALGRLAGQSAEDKDKESARETIEPLLEGDFRQVLSAVAGLQSLKDVKAIPALNKLARTSHDSRIKKRAADAAEAIRASQGTSKQVSELRDEHEKLKTDYEKLVERLDKVENKDDSKPAKKKAETKKSRPNKAAPKKAVKKIAKKSVRKAASKRKPTAKKAKAVKKKPSAKKKPRR
ncbi:MAG: HEAT repeat domain-containing protein, partial [Planctomycetota bacterium]